MGNNSAKLTWLLEAWREDANNIPLRMCVAITVDIADDVTHCVLVI